MRVRRLKKLEIALIAGFIFALIMNVVPQIDLTLAAVFYHPIAGFYAKDWLVFQAVYWFLRYLPYVLVPALFALLAFTFTTFSGRWPFLRQQVVFLLLVLALGPGLLVNAVLKEHWGRARPHQIVEFGGVRQFTPVLIVSNQCESNCSFVSGHASMGFFLASFAYVVARNRFWLVYLSGIGMGVYAGIGRMAQGGHFFSDVVLAGWLVLLLAHSFAKLLMEERAN